MSSIPAASRCWRPSSATSGPAVWGDSRRPWSPILTAEPYRDSVYIAAGARLVFDYFTRPEALVRWMGDLAVVDPRPGGEFTLFFGGSSVRGRYLEVDPPRRLVISWGRGGSADFPPEASTLEVTLRPEGEGTRVTIVHSGLPDAEAPKHAAGWRGFLARLVAVAGAAVTPPGEPRRPPGPGSAGGPPAGPAPRT